MIINKAYLNFVDNNTGTILSNEVSLNENEVTLDYLHKKIEKLKTLNIMKVNVLKDNKFFNTDGFDRLVLTKFCKASQEGIYNGNFYLLTLNLTDDYENDINVAIKLDLEKTETIINNNNELLFGYELSVPKMSSGIKEAIIVDNTVKDIYVIESKISYEDIKDFYISNVLIGGSPYLKYKSVFDTYLNGIKFVNEVRCIDSEIKLISDFFEYVEECKITDRYLTVENVATRLFEEDDDSKGVFINSMQNLLHKGECDIPTVLLNKELRTINIKAPDIQLKVSCDLVHNNDGVLLDNKGIIIKNDKPCKIG